MSDSHTTDAVGPTTSSAVNMPSRTLRMFAEHAAAAVGLGVVGLATLLGFTMEALGAREVDGAGLAALPITFLIATSHLAVLTAWVFHLRNRRQANLVTERTSDGATR